MLRGWKCEAGLHEHVRFKCARDEIGPGVAEVGGGVEAERLDKKGRIRRLKVAVSCRCARRLVADVSLSLSGRIQP
jgi:hypothetical protein